MNAPLRMDLRAQAELLAFLVISQFATRYATHDWMDISQTIESMLFYPKLVKRDENVLCRARLASRSLPVARAIAAETSIELSGSSMALIFDSKLQLNFSCALTREIYGRCLTHLLRTKWYL